MAEFRPLSAIESSLRKYLGGGQGGTVLGAGYTDKINYVDPLIANTAYEYPKKIETKEQIIVGNNEFQEDKNDLYETQAIDEKEIKDQLYRLNSFIENRNNHKVKY